MPGETSGLQSGPLVRRPRRGEPCTHQKRGEHARAADVPDHRLDRFQHRQHALRRLGPQQRRQLAGRHRIGAGADGDAHHRQQQDKHRAQHQREGRLTLAGAIPPGGH